LPFLGYLLENLTTSILIGRERMVPIMVPHPGRFCIHKLAVYNLRGATDSSKREKDIFQSALLAAALAEEHDFFLQEAIEAMSRPLRTRVKPAAKRVLQMLQADYPPASETLARLS
jgi:hypothetical protein